MNLKKLSPWNWFKKEHQEQQTLFPAELPYRTDFPLEHLHRDIDRLFSNFFGSQSLASTGFPTLDTAADWVLKPSVNIAETDRAYKISVEIPGVDKDDVRLSVEDGTLIIEGEKRQEKDENEKNFHRIERRYGSFRRLISIPNDTDESNIDAKFKNGVLTISLSRNPVQPSEAKTIRIDQAA